MAIVHPPASLAREIAERLTAWSGGMLDVFYSGDRLFLLVDDDQDPHLGLIDIQTPCIKRSAIAELRRMAAFYADLADRLEDSLGDALDLTPDMEG